MIVWIDCNIVWKYDGKLLIDSWYLYGNCGFSGLILQARRNIYAYFPAIVRQRTKMLAAYSRLSWSGHYSNSPYRH